MAARNSQARAPCLRLAVEVRPFGPHPLVGLGVDDLRRMAPVRPGDVLHIEGEVVSLTPSRTKPQGIARVKWTAFTQGSGIYIHSHRDRAASAGRLNGRSPYRLISPIRFQGAGGGRLQQSRQRELIYDHCPTLVKASR